MSKTLGNLLRDLAGVHPKQWDDFFFEQWDECLPQAAFSYNSIPKRSTECAPFVAAYGHLPKNVMDATSEPSENKWVEYIIENSKAVQKKVIEALERTT